MFAYMCRMRIPRSIQLFPEFGCVHKFWKCHNNEFLIKNSRFKDLYLNCTKFAITHSSVEECVQLQSFCIMDNHTHMQMSYDGNSERLSKFMRISHARFGLLFNREANRSGKVANERPKTPLIEDSEHNMRVHLYIESNPIRARMMSLEELKNWDYCSYGYYAHGKTTEWTGMLTAPDWYIRLGETSEERQISYRKLFREYINSDIGLVTPSYERTTYIGNEMWTVKMYGMAKDIIRAKKHVVAKPPLKNSS